MKIKHSLSQRTNITQLSKQTTLHATTDLQSTTIFDRFLPTFLILIALLFTCNLSIAQEENTNEIPPNCTCLNFVYACNGMPATALVGGTVSITCGENSYDYTIGSDLSGNPVLCVTDGIFSCFGTIRESAILCISEGNWEVCNISGCTVTVDQTLTVEPNINGTLLGYGEYLVPGQSGGTILCEGRNYTGALNTIDGATDLLVCPGDQMFLELEDLDVPLNSGMCLFVEITSTSGTVLTSQTFSGAFINNGAVNITNLLAGLESNQTYMIHMRLKCCSGDDCFDTNSYRYAYIILDGKFSYKPYSTSGYNDPIYSFVPASSPPGSTMGFSLPVGIPGLVGYQNFITFTGYDVINPEGVDINYSWYSTNCTSDPSDDWFFSGGVATGNDPFDVNPLFLFYDIFEISDCHCYRLDLTYDDGCTDNPVTDSYYWRLYDDCLKGPDDHHDDE